MTRFSSAVERGGALCGKRDDKDVFHLVQEPWRAFFASLTNTFFGSAVEKSGVLFGKYLHKQDDFQFSCEERRAFRKRLRRECFSVRRSRGEARFLKNILTRGREEFRPRAA